MLLFRVILLVFYVNITKSLRPLSKLHEDIHPVQSAPITHFQPLKDNGINTGVASRRFVEDVIVDDLESNSGEVFSAELGSNADDNYRRNGQSYLNYRRNVKPNTKLYQKRMYHVSASTDVITSSSLESNEFKAEWAERWDAMKEDALHFKNNDTLYHQDKFTMVAARPWYTPCGDPNQHDLPWGSCLLNNECEPEYRIYRGDILCGRTSLICCAVERFRNDMNAAIELSFAESSRDSTSSESIRRIERGSKENRRRKKKHKKNLVRAVRRKQKKNLKKLIRRLTFEIEKQIGRAYRNNSNKRTLATYNLKRLVKHMKHKFRKDRQAAIDNNNQELINISDIFAKKIGSMRYLNLHFLTNETFREIAVNGTITKKIARQLLEVDPALGAYPEMKMFLDIPQVHNNARRSGSRRRKRVKPRDSLQYYIMDYIS